MHPTANRPTMRLWFGGALGLASLLAIWFQHHREQAAHSVPAQHEVPGTSPQAGANPPSATLGMQQLAGGVAVQAGTPSEEGVPGSESPAARAERRKQAEERLAAYRTFANYPPGSRPARENSDQLFPMAPVLRGTPLSHAGQPSEHILLKLRQDRLVVVGEESIELGIRCEDSQASVLPCAVQSAQVSALPLESGKPPGQRPVSFVKDQAAGRQGELVATLRPIDLKLVDTTWPLRVDVKLQAGRDPVEQGSAMFDFLFTPEPPAVSTGPVREAVVDGSLTLTYGLSVKRAGRYVLHARVDDAAGKPVGYLEWNELLKVGQQEVKLVLFGKLLIDENPRWPLKVRDFDGFLLKEGVDPDREQIPTRSGYQNTTQVYSLSAFSKKEWQSEEKSRHEREFEKDVEQAGP